MEFDAHPSPAPILRCCKKAGSRPVRRWGSPPPLLACVQASVSLWDRGRPHPQVLAQDWSSTLNPCLSGEFSQPPLEPHGGGRRWGGGKDRSVQLRR